MPDEPLTENTQDLANTEYDAERTSTDRPTGGRLADNSKNTSTGTVKPQDGPTERPGTEAEKKAQREGK